MLPYIELLHIAIKTYMQKEFHVIILYRPPASDPYLFIEALYKLLCNLNYSKFPLIILGDFNFDLLVRDSLHVKDIILKLKSFCFKPLFASPTHETPHSSTCIDWLLSNVLASSLIHDIKLSDVSFSDHKVILFTLKKLKIKKVKKEICLKKYDKKSINKFLNLLSVSDNSSIKLLIDNTNRLDDICFETYTLTKKVSESTEDWISLKLINLIRLKTIIFQQYKYNHNIINKQRLEDIKKKCKHQTILDQKNFYKKKLSKYELHHNSKQYWNLLKKFFESHNPPNQGVIHLKDSHGNLISSTKEVCSLFNNHFSTVVNKLKENNIINNDPNLQMEFPTDLGLFNFQPCCISDVSSIISKLKPTSVDTKFIQLKIIKFSLVYFCEQLCFYINRSFMDGNFPECIKTSKVIPIYKKGTKTDANNYRPISILPSISKIFERIAYHQLKSHFKRHHLIIPNQFGFLEGNSTESAMLHLLSTVAEAFDKKQYICILFIDYSKAFDSVHHNLLLKKLNYQFGISTKANNWLRTFLTGRKQYVSIGKHASSLATISFGVPQGSVLGPLLFLCYINDIIACLKIENVHVIQYADDTAVLISSPSINNLQNKVITVLSKIYDYCSENHVFINLSKTKVMYLKRNINDSKEINVTNQGNPIESVSNYCYLGYTIDDELNFKIHLNKLSNKLSTCNFFLARSYSTLPRDAVILLYNSFILSHILYSKFILLIVSNNRKKNIIKNIKVAGSIIENCALRHVTHYRYDISHILKFYCFKLIQSITYNGFSPQIANRLPIKQHSYFTKKSNEYYYKRYSSPKCKVGVQFFIHNIWNYIPQTVRSNLIISFEEFYNICLKEL